ncbi:MAG: hypothetical protein BBJ57_07415 [Desulfobacterales bacterium PC51MH44]|nr:MAG: hypothetical protein BBJ57_07415 [Desulfobacterales bacterium PC51MH44]
MEVINGGKDKNKTSIKNPDWEAIETDLTTTVMSGRAIAKKYGVSEGTIRYYIKKEGIERDLSRKVKTAVRNRMLRTPLRKKPKVRKSENTGLRKPTEKEIIDAAVEENMNFIGEWDKIFLKTVGIAKLLKAEIFKKVKVKIPAKGGKRARTITADKLDAKERATVFNAIVKAETGVFEAMRKNLGIEETGGQAAPDLLMDYGTGDYEAELKKRKT